MTRPWLRASTVFVLSTVTLLAIQLAINTGLLRNDLMFEMRLWLAMPMTLPLVVPLAMLPLMMRLRRQLTMRHAAQAIAAGAVISIVVAGWLTPLAQSDFASDRLDEAMYQRSVANDRAGRPTYPWSALRALRPTTAEERAEQRRRWRSDPRYLAAEAERTRPRWNLATFRIGALTVALGALGWTLAGIGRTRAIDGAAWWVLSLLLILLADGRIVYWINNAGIRLGRAPAWTPLAVFGTAALLIAIAGRRHRMRDAMNSDHEIRSPDH